jgi:hypothetical protein
VRADFAECSGGFGPESGAEVSTYIEGSLGVDVDPEGAVEELLAWMNELADDLDGYSHICASSRFDTKK